MSNVYEDSYIYNFEYPKQTIEDPKDGSYIEVDYDRLRELLSLYLKESYELAILSGAIDMKTGDLREDYPQSNAVDYIEWQLLEVVDLVSKFKFNSRLGTYFVDCLTALLKEQPIKPLTGLDWEWIDISDMANLPENSLLQNARYPSIFKEGEKAFWSGDMNQNVTFPCVVRRLEKQIEAEGNVELKEYSNANE